MKTYLFSRAFILDRALPNVDHFATIGFCKSLRFSIRGGRNISFSMCFIFVFGRSEDKLHAKKRFAVLWYVMLTLMSTRLWYTLSCNAVLSSQYTSEVSIILSIWLSEHTWSEFMYVLYFLPFFKMYLSTTSSLLNYYSTEIILLFFILTKLN